MLICVRKVQLKRTKSSLLTQPLQSNGTLYHSISQFASLNWQQYRTRHNPFAQYNPLLSQNCELITLACSISCLLSLMLSTCCHVSLFLATLFPVHTVLSHSHFPTLLYPLAVTFLSRLLVNPTLSLHLVPFSLVILLNHWSIYLLLSRVTDAMSY